MGKETLAVHSRTVDKQALGSKGMAKIGKGSGGEKSMKSGGTKGYSWKIKGEKKNCLEKACKEESQVVGVRLIEKSKRGGDRREHTKKKAKDKRR